MQNWQKSRNYRKYKNEYGTYRYVITVDGEDVEVSADVYAVYSQSDRRERYIAERESGVLLSLDQFDEDGVQFSCHYTESAEDSVLHRIEQSQLLSALSDLDDGERDLIQALYYDGVTEQGYAECVGVSQVAIHRRKNRILTKLSDLLVIKP